MSLYIKNENLSKIDNIKIENSSKASTKGAK